MERPPNLTARLPMVGGKCGCPVCKQVPTVALERQTR